MESGMDGEASRQGPNCCSGAVIGTNKSSQAIGAYDSSALAFDREEGWWKGSTGTPPGPFRLAPKGVGS